MVAVSITIAIAIVAVTVVVAVRLGRQAGVLVRETAASAERLGPLLEELNDEAVVTQAELEELRERTARLRGATPDHRVSAPSPPRGEHDLH